MSFEKVAGSRPRSGRRLALRGDDKYSVCRLKIHDLNAPSNSSLLSLVPKHIGQSIERFQDNALLSGRGRFVDNLGVKPGASHAAILRSPHAHARLIGINSDKASKLPGVRAIITRDDAKRHCTR